MNTQKTVTFCQFFKFELRVSLSLLLFAFLVEVFISLIQGVIIWDEYILLGFLFFAFLYLLLVFLLGLLSTLAGYFTSGRGRPIYLKFFGVAFPSSVVALLYLVDEIPPQVALVLFPGISKTAFYLISVVVVLLIIWGIWRFWLGRKPPETGSVEQVHDGILFLALASIWIFSMDMGFIVGYFHKLSRLAFGFAWFAIILLALPLVKAFSRRLTRDFFLSTYTLTKKGKLSGALFFLLTMGYCLVLTESYNPHSPDRYAMRSHAVADSTEKPNVFLFILDTFRADQLFDQGEELAPNLTSLFPSCVVFKQAYSPSSWTLPATRSIFSSLYPTTAIKEISESPLALHTLTEILAESGFQTMGVSANITATGPLFAQGFDRYYVYIRHYVYESFVLFRLLPFLPQRIILTCLRGIEFGTLRLNRRVLEMLPNSRERPLFLYVHFNEPHFPYYDEDAFLGGVYLGSGRLASYTLLEELYTGKTELEVEPEKLAEMFSRYQGEIRSLDRGLGQFFESLRRKDLWDNSLIIIVSDHGEEFLEHLRWGHGQSLYQELIHVPLLLKFPKGAAISPQVIGSPVNTIDITPTILDFLGRSDLATEMQGRSLLPLIRGEKEGGTQLIFSEVNDSYYDVIAYTTIEDSLKFIISHPENGVEEFELYNIVKDPGEKNNLWRESEEALGMKERCENFINHLQAGELREKSKFDPQTLKRLKAMGYLR